MGYFHWLPFWCSKRGCTQNAVWITKWVALFPPITRRIYRSREYKVCIFHHYIERIVFPRLIKTLYEYYGWRESVRRCTNIDLRPEAITAVCPADLIPINFLVLFQNVHALNIPSPKQGVKNGEHTDSIVLIRSRRENGQINAPEYGGETAKSAENMIMVKCK